MYYLVAGYGKHRRMRNAILAALVLHVSLLVWLSFSPESKRNYALQIEVTLALRADKPNTDDASHIWSHCMHQQIVLRIGLQAEFGGYTCGHRYGGYARKTD